MYYYACTPYTAYVAAIYNIVAMYIHCSYDNLLEVASEFIDNQRHMQNIKKKRVYTVFKHGDYKA